jgi:heme exporter protein D
LALHHGARAAYPIAWVALALEQLQPVHQGRQGIAQLVAEPRQKLGLALADLLQLACNVVPSLRPPTQLLRKSSRVCR